MPIDIAKGTAPRQRDILKTCHFQGRRPFYHRTARKSIFFPLETGFRQSAAEKAIKVANKKKERKGGNTVAVTSKNKKREEEERARDKRVLRFRENGRNTWITIGREFWTLERGRVSKNRREIIRRVSLSVRIPAFLSQLTRIPLMKFTFHSCNSRKCIQCPPPSAQKGIDVLDEPGDRVIRKNMSEGNASRGLV